MRTGIFLITGKGKLWIIESSYLVNSAGNPLLQILFNYLVILKISHRKTRSGIVR
jgi:hypothetical protein